MSEPAKKFGVPPESYSPKAKPEILKLAQQAQGTNAAVNEPRINAVSGGEPPKILRGVPKVHYGAFGGITPFPICLKAVSDYLGDELDYTYAMAASGGAFRFAWNTAEWDGGNVDIALAYADTERPYRQGVEALGREFHMLWREGNAWGHPGSAAKEDVKAFIREQIDLGRPVISLGPIGPAEAGILTGYSDGGDKLLGWSLFQWDGDGMGRDEEGYFITDKYWDEGDFVAVMSLGDVSGPRFGVKEILRNAIAALEGRHEGKHAKGIAAYDAWKAALLAAGESDLVQAVGDGGNAGMFDGMNIMMMCQGDATDCLVDGRAHAGKYFAALAREHPEQPLYAQIAEQFGIVADTIHKKIYKALRGYQRDKKQIKALQKLKTRQKIAGYIDEMKAADEKALALMKELLAESYSPKAKPEILKLAAEEQGHLQALDASRAASPPGGSGAVPVIHRLITSMHGENYWFNGCAAYVMECLGEPDYDYWFFAGLTGDNFAQVYARDHFRGDGCVTDYRLSDGDTSFVLDVFSRCGYQAEFIPETVLRADPRPWLQKLVDSIDRGIPVVRYWCGWHVCVGYEDGGQTLLCMTGDNEEPYRVTAEELFEGGQEHKDVFHWFGWIFVGEKTEQKDLRQLYREAVLGLPRLLTTETEGYCCGAGAFRALADMLESDRFDGGKPEGFDGWDTYTVYTCNLATNSGGCQGFLQKAMELNPDLGFLAEVGRQYRLTNFLWNKGEWRKNMLTRRERRAYVRRYGRDNLESLKLGIHNFSEKAFFNSAKRAKAAAILREMAGCMDEVVRLVESYSPKTKPEILRMAAQRQSEALVGSFTVRKAVFELHDRPEVLWVGTLAWAADNDSEPDTDALLKKFQALCGPAPKLERMHPDWSAGISINYNLGGKAPRGMLFAQETWSAQQDGRYDMYTQPAGLYLRLRLDKHAEKLMGKKHYRDADMYGLLEKTAKRYGYRRARGNPIEIFYHDHEHHTAKYAVIPVEKTPEGHSPKAKPAILSLAQAMRGGALPSDAIADPFAGGDPPRASNRITQYRRIQPWENYFLASALCSVGRALGSDIDSLHFYSAITGDMFTPLYSTKREYCDSGVTNSFFAPQVVKKAYAAMGYDCVYLSKEYIGQNFRTVMNAIKASVDKGIPVLAWGMDLPEAGLIGGYDGDTLYVNLYCGPERVEQDDDGYTAITGGLDTTQGLFFVGEPIGKTPPREVYREAIASIPALLSLPPKDGYLFGQAAFDTWAGTLLDESNFAGKTDEEIEGLGVTWDIHCAPYCTVCTSDALNFVKTAAKEHNIAPAKKLLPLYKKFTKRRQKIWKLQGGFSPPVKKFRQRKFREKIGKILREMGALCAEIAAA